MTVPVIRGRAGRAPLPLMHPANYPVSGLPLSAASHICTFAQEHRSDLHLCTIRKRYASTNSPLRTWISTQRTLPTSNPHNFATAIRYKSI